MKKEVCSTQDYLVSGETFSIRWDESKGYASTHPQPAADKLGSHYESAAYLSHNESQQSVVGPLYRMARKYMFRIKHKMFKKWLPANSSILDYGCGTGGFLEYTSSKAYASFGAETNTYARDQAIRKGLTVVSSWEQLPQEKFNLISLWHVLEHVSDLDQCIQEIQKRLNTNDILLIAVPNLNAFDAIYYAEFWAAYDVPRHLWHFSQRGIKQLIEPCGFELIAQHPLILDALYIAYVSEKHKGSRFALLKGIFRGLQSNWKAKKTGEYSSLVYLFRKAK
tara:strand:+ start:1902 stop:2741 length:840 start_codon:yes stop_codon:yes gene_type:complete